MRSEHTNYVPYSGEIWQADHLHPRLWELLMGEDLLIELTCGEPPYQVVLGVPHHAGPGVDHIAEAWQNPKTGRLGRPADESAGLMGLAAFTALREKGIPCKLVIAAHPTDHDPNKTPGSPYWQSVFTPPLPGLLFELHGAARHRRHALELSAGSNSVVDPLRCGRVLAYFFQQDEILAVQARAGSSDAELHKNHQSSNGKLQNPAIETHSLAYAGALGIPALHLEMKSAYRRPDMAFPGFIRPTAQAWDLARAIASTLELLGRPEEVHISAADAGLPGSAFLTRPSLEFEESYLRAIDETPVHEMDGNPELRIWSHESFVRLVQDTRAVNYYGLPEHPPEEYLWLIDRGEFIGRVFFLHWLNEYRLKNDGQVDYWIRPSRRRQGYGRIILGLLLARYRQLGLERVLVSCLASNLPSQKIIAANGGIYEGEIEETGLNGLPNKRQRYWINLSGK